MRLSDSTIYVIMGFAAGALMLGPSAKSAIHTLFGYGINSTCVVLLMTTKLMV